MSFGAILRRKLMASNNFTMPRASLIVPCWSNNITMSSASLISPCRHASTSTSPKRVSFQPTIWSIFQAIPRSLGLVLDMTSNEWMIKWYDCQLLYYTVIVNIQLNVNLLLDNGRITKLLISKILEGDSLCKRERHLLAQTSAYIFRLVPGSLVVLSRSMHFLLPLILRFYPKLLSSTQDKLKRRQMATAQSQIFFQDAAIQMAKAAPNSPPGHTIPTVQEFTRFITDVKLSSPVSTENIFRFAALFHDEVTLDYVSRPLLSDMCTLMGIMPFGKYDDLRLILCDKLKSIKNDDTFIQSKGVELLSEAEICKACTERGMHVTEEMQQQLHDWLDLSLNHAVPTSLLIISRVITRTQKLKPEEVMLATLSSLPHDLIYAVGVASLPCKDPILDKNRKIGFLKLQEKIIKEEEKELSEMEQSDAVQNA